MKEIIIDGRKLTVYNRSLNSSYLVYDNKIWKWTSKSGQGKNFVLVIERPLTNEKVILKGDDIKKIEWIISPTGYIKI